IARGATQTFRIKPGAYQVRIASCDRQQTGEIDSAQFRSPTTLVYSARSGLAIKGPRGYRTFVVHPRMPPKVTPTQQGMDETAFRAREAQSIACHQRCVDMNNDMPCHQECGAKFPEFPY